MAGKIDLGCRRKGGGILGEVKDISKLFLEFQKDLDEDDVGR